MRRPGLLFLAVIPGVCGQVSLRRAAPASHERVNFDAGWRFANGWVGAAEITVLPAE
jgi:hypothetical protein